MMRDIQRHFRIDVKLLYTEKIDIYRVSIVKTLYFKAVYRRNYCSEVGGGNNKGAGIC